MKTSNKKKIIVSTLALAMGAALAGSISGSVAWYQYSTRATASLQGTSAGTSRNLKISTDGSNWGWDISNDQIKTASAGKSRSADLGLKPVGAYKTSAGVLSFSSHGIRQEAFVAADGDEYAEFDLYLQSYKEGNPDPVREAVDVYLETFNVTFDTGYTKLADALRIAIKVGETETIYSKTALTGGTKQVTQGQLDLNGDTCDDRNIFEADDRTGLAKDGSGVWKKVLTKSFAKDEVIPEGTYFKKYTNYALSEAAPSVGPEGGATYYYLGDEPTDYITYKSGTANTDVNEYTTTAWEDLDATFTDPYTDPTDASPIGQTTAAGDYLKLTFKIWLEGWAEIDGSNIWSSALIGGGYSIQMRFQTVAEK